MLVFSRPARDAADCPPFSRRDPGDLGWREADAADKGPCPWPQSCSEARALSGGERVGAQLGPTALRYGGALLSEYPRSRARVLSQCGRWWACGRRRIQRLSGANPRPARGWRRALAQRVAALHRARGWRTVQGRGGAGPRLGRGCPGPSSSVRAGTSHKAFLPVHRYGVARAACSSSKLTNMAARGAGGTTLPPNYNCSLSLNLAGGSGHFPWLKTQPAQRLLAASRGWPPGPPALRGPGWGPRPPHQAPRPHPPRHMQS